MRNCINKTLKEERRITEELRVIREQLHNLLNRCLELKNANIEIFAKQNQSNAYSEELLAFFELEIGKWKKLLRKKLCYFQVVG